MGLRELEGLGWQGVPQLIRAAAICHSLKIFTTKKRKQIFTTNSYTVVYTN